MQAGVLSDRDVVTHSTIKRPVCRNKSKGPRPFIGVREAARSRLNPTAHNVIRKHFTTNANVIDSHKPGQPDSTCEPSVRWSAMPTAVNKHTRRRNTKIWRRTSVFAMLYTRYPWQFIHVKMSIHIGKGYYTHHSKTNRLRCTPRIPLPHCVRMGFLRSPRRC